MFTNLFVQFPEGEHKGQLWEFAWRQLPLALHIIVGLALLFGTIALIVRAVKLKNRLWTIASSIAALAILAAGIGGAAFIPSQTDAYSFMMAIGFMIALLAFGWGLYTSK